MKQLNYRKHSKHNLIDRGKHMIHLQFFILKGLLFRVEAQSLNDIIFYI